MPYGSIKVDTLTFTNAGVDKSVSISGLVQNPTFTGNVTVTGTVSGATVRATTVSGVTISGTTANCVSGVFTTQISGAIHVAPAGTAGAPSVQVGTGASIAPGLYSPATDQLGISTGGSFRLVVDSTGRVGIGTSNPQATLDVSGKFRVDTTNAFGAISFARPDGNHMPFIRGADNTGTLPALRMGDLSGSEAAMDISGTGNIIFYTNTATTERMRIDSSGRLLVGTSSARSNFFNSTISSLFQIEGASSNTSDVSRFCSHIFGNNDIAGPVVVLGKHRSNSVGGNTVVQSGDQLGGISFQGSDGTEFVSSALILAEVDGTPGANDMPGCLVFSTTADGAPSPTERLRVDSNGFAKHTGAIGRGVPVTKTGNFTVGIAENWLICNGTASITVTLPTASAWTGREIMLKTIAEFTVISASSNVVPLAGGAASTAILAATTGKYATLVSDGTNWIIMQAN